VPCLQTTGALRDGVTNLGSGTARFKDAYLSGGVYVGGTGSANKLDDYEEGTWTPTLTFGGSDTGITYSNQIGRYTKIGNQVTLHCYLRTSSLGTATGVAKILGLPFSSVNVGSLYQYAAVWINNADLGNYVDGSHMSPNVALINLWKRSLSSSTGTTMTESDFTSTVDFMVNLTYQV